MVLFAAASCVPGSASNLVGVGSKFLVSPVVTNYLNIYLRVRVEGSDTGGMRVPNGRRMLICVCKLANEASRNKVLDISQIIDSHLMT